MNKELKGCYAVLMTPFIGNRVDFETFEKQVTRLSRSGISGYVVNGSTAEFAHMNADEKKRVVQIVAQVKDDNKQLIVSACEPNVADAHKVCMYAKWVNADAVLVCAPYYFKYTAEEIKQYIQHMKTEFI